MLWRMIAMVLVSFTLVVPLEGQRAGGGMHGGAMPRSGHGPGFVVNGDFPSAPFNRNLGFRHFRNFGWYGAPWIGWDSPWNCWYWALDSRGNWCGDSPQIGEAYQGSAQNRMVAPIIIERSTSAPPALPPEPKMIEATASKAPSQAEPPAIFVLANGERLEATRYMLTVDSVDVEAGARQRKIPMSQLNIQQTLAANHERGIEIKIPHNSSQIFLGF